LACELHDSLLLKYLQTPVTGRVGGSTLMVLAIRGDAATDQLEVAEIRECLAVAYVVIFSCQRVVFSSNA
jgi:hypothetical protein